MNEASTDPRRQLLLDLFGAGLGRVDGRRCVAQALAGHRLHGPVRVAAVGKAAAAMVLGAQDALGCAVERTLLITKDDHVTPQVRGLRNVEIYESAHPVPDSRSVLAGGRLLRWVDELPAHSAALFLISGGASSLVEVLEEGVTLGDLARLNSQGLAEGVAIGELNARRARLSRLKGGGLAGRLRGRAALALFISDVPDDDPGVIGSGLLGPARQGPDQVTRVIVASVGHATQAVRAAVARLGLEAAPPAERFDGEAGRLAIRFAHELCLNVGRVCVWGGESTVRLPQQPGRGGRNQHLALTAAKLICGQANLFLLAAGTDGTDGPTEDAGAMVDAETLARISLAGLDVDRCLRRADANAALAASGDLLHTGPTGTNVGDLVIGLNLTADAARSALHMSCGAPPDAP